MQEQIKKTLPMLIFVTFLVFYTVQITEYTSKNDIILFSARSLQEQPILNYAYLDSTTMMGNETLPNYHLGHTIFLWLFYKFIPIDYVNTIWPAGFLSAISGALSILLTYLICLKLNFTKKTSLIISIIYGIIPSIWEHSIIGELYSLQMLFILLFLYAFLKDNLFWSTISFYVANTISPLSALSFTLFLLKGSNKKTIIRAFAVGIGALCLYILTFLLIDLDVSVLFGKVSEEMEGRGLLYRIMILGVFIFLNFHLLLYYFISGYSKLFSEKKMLILALTVGITPQLLLLFVSPGFFIEKGSFQIPFFWAMTIPVGVAISELKKPTAYLVLSLIISVSLTYTFWIYPHYSVGSSLAEAGKYLKKENYEDVSIIGSYGAAINLLKYRNGLCLDTFNRYFYDCPMPGESDILETKREEILIVHHKKTPLRKLISTIGIKGLEIKEYKPQELITVGNIEKIFDNNAVTIYKWRK